MNTLTAHPGVSLPGAIKLFFKRYIDFSGRSSRSEYWWCALTYAVIISLLMIPYLVSTASMVSQIETDPLTGAPTPVAPGMPVGAMIASSIMSLFVLGIMVGAIALILRRLRDSGTNPLMILVSLVPFIGAIWLLVLLAKESSTLPSDNGVPPYGAATQAGAQYNPYQQQQQPGYLQ